MINLWRAQIRSLKFIKIDIGMLGGYEINTINRTLSGMMDDVNAAFTGGAYCFDDSTFTALKQDSPAEDAYNISAISSIDSEISALEAAIAEEEARIAAEEAAKAAAEEAARQKAKND